jgi:erythromycin esterase-like protein
VRLPAPWIERFVGVVNLPDTDLVSHFSEASLAKQFDAFVWFDEATA